MSKALIKMKPKPKRPDRNEKIRQTYRIYEDGEPLKAVVKWIEDLGADLNDVFFGSDGDYDGCYTHYLWMLVPESEESYSNRLEAYRRRLEKYNKWYLENKNLIEQEIARRAQAATEKAEKKNKKRKGDIEKEVKQLEKELEKLERMSNNA